MNYFEQKLSSEIARKVGDRLESFDFRALPKPERSRQTEGIKELVISGTNEIRVLSDNRFEVDLSAYDFSRALTKDYFDGICRIRSLFQTLSIVLDSDACSAWQVVTLYYIGFFSAVEILRAYGDYISYFDGSAVAIIEQGASINAGTLESGSYRGDTRYDVSSGGITISYAKSGIGHHQHAWNRVAALAQSSCRWRNKEEQTIVGRVIEALGMTGRANVQFATPSDTRNYWNYVNPKLFGKSGRSASMQLTKLLKSPGSTLCWVRGKSNHANLSDATCALGFSSEFLRTVIEGLGEKIVPE